MKHYTKTHPQEEEQPPPELINSTIRAFENRSFALESKEAKEQQHEKNAHISRQEMCTRRGSKGEGRQ